MVRFISIILILLFFPFANSSSEQIELVNAPTKSGYYTVTYKNHAINLELSINGYPIKESSTQTDASGQSDINYWIVPGKNILSYRLTPRKGKSKKDIDLTPDASFKLLIGQQGQFPEDGEQLLSYEWTQNNQSNLIADGKWKTIEWDPPFLPPSQLWSVAQKIEMSAAMQASAIAYVEAYTKALNSKDLNQIFPFVSFRAKDTSETRYFPYDQEKEKKSMEGFVKTFGSSWKFNKKKVKASLICNQLILSLSDSKGNPILNGKDGVAIPIYLSLIDGKWTISR
jgi:hypothetical protein